MYKSNGFTLVELLVTLSIIAILAFIALASYDSLTKNARDGQRKSDLKTIQSALEQYYRDQGFYPAANLNPGSPLTNLLGNPSSPAPSSKPYINNVPGEAVDSTHPYLYLPFTAAGGTCDNSSTSICAKYCLFAEMENSTNNNLVTECPNTISGASTYNYSVSSP